VPLAIARRALLRTDRRQDSLQGFHRRPELLAARLALEFRGVVQVRFEGEEPGPAARRWLKTAAQDPDGLRPAEGQLGHPFAWLLPFMAAFEMTTGEPFVQDETLARDLERLLVKTLEQPREGRHVLAALASSARAVLHSRAARFAPQALEALSCQELFFAFLYAPW